MSTPISTAVAYSVLTPPLFVGHVFWNAALGDWLFELAGGIRRSQDPAGWDSFGGIDWAWGTPLYIPGCDIMTKSNIGPCIWRGGEWGLPLIAVASLLTAVVTAQFIQAWVNKDPSKLGRWYWRGVIMFLGWMFVPLPVKWVWAYQFIVLC